MKAVILAGGLGTRLAEETSIRPKPLVEVGGKPILWHIMKTFSHHGITEFVICLGYKGFAIKEYFSNYFLHTSDVTFDIAANKMHIHSVKSEPWSVTLVDTGESTMTGGRVKRIIPFVQDEDCFCLTYGDGVGDVDITELVRQHRDNGLIATVTGVAPPNRFGVLEVEGNLVTSFEEKPVRSAAMINGGFFVVSPKVDKFIQGDATVFEREPLEALAKAGQLGVYRHEGFWQPMDTLRDKMNLNMLWDSGRAPWKVWD